MTKPAMLVVEDDLLVRMNLVDRLDAAGYRVLEAGSADEAIGVLQAHDDIRVLFTDIQMPGSMDGLQLSHYVSRQYPPTIIVICSGRVRPAAQDMPANASFLRKPIEPRVMDHTLARLKDHLAA